MGWLRFIHRRRADAEVQSEIESYLEEETAENLARGMMPDEARRQARIKLGNQQCVRERLWQQNTIVLIESAWRDFRYAVRTLRRSPGFSLLAMLVMVLGIGANVALFTIVRAVLLNPLPFAEPSGLIKLYEHSSDRFPFNEVAGGVFAAWEKESHSFAGLALFDNDLAFSLSEGGGQLPEKVNFGVCTWNLFPLLGVEPALGRSFTASDDRSQANATVMLTWGLWKRRFGGNPAILGRTIKLDAKPYTVIGVLPEWFTYPVQSVQLWTPIYHLIPASEMNAIDSHDWEVIGRLKPGVSEAQATGELSVIVRRLHDQHLDDPYISTAAASKPLLEDLVGDFKTPLYLLLAATTCLLFIACLNTAGLMVSREAARRKELAIRSALGAGRWRLLREHIAESLVLSAISGAAGLVVAYAAIRWFVHARQDLSRVETIHLDGASVAFTVCLTLLCALCAGFASILSFRGGQIGQSLAVSSRSQSEGVGRARLRKWLVAIEIGVTVVLLVGAGLLLKSYAELRSSDMGCLTKNVLTMQLSLPDDKYSEPLQRMNFFDTLLERVRMLPGVSAAGLVRTVPGQGRNGDWGFTIAENPPLPMGQQQLAIARWADPGYFHAMGIPLLRGHSFDASKRLANADEAVISASLAQHFFGTEDPIGKHLITDGRRFQIVGVVGDTRYLASRPVEPMVYFSIESGDFGSAALVVRSAGDVTTLALPIQKIVQQLDPQLAVMDILTMDQVIGRSILDTTFDAELLLMFAGLSLLFATVGLFGVLSFITAQRTQEIGIRMALGAQRERVLEQVLLDGLKPALMGLVLGLAGSVGAVQLVRSMLYATRPLDPAVFALVSVVLLAVAVAACLSPAWRASRLDPMQALRTE
ncbi:MAG TPA: ABC transporter permease [Acidobacteriaceae bacterium]|nr:ABC transporter permease [Acidobacteriaceae bacterium]